MSTSKGPFYTKHQEFWVMANSQVSKNFLTICHSQVSWATKNYSIYWSKNMRLLSIKRNWLWITKYSLWVSGMAAQAQNLALFYTTKLMVIQTDRPAECSSKMLQIVLKENKLLYIDAERYTPYRRMGRWGEAHKLVSRIRASNDETLTQTLHWSRISKVV